MMEVIGVFLKTFRICKKEKSVSEMEFLVILDFGFVDFIKACNKCCHLYIPPNDGRIGKGKGHLRTDHED